MNFVRDVLVRLARQFAGTFYLWGGAGPAKDGSFGFDCSGFVIFLLRPFSLLPERGDWTAAQLAGMFRATSAPEPGDLVFYGPAESKINHVMFFLGGSPAMCIGAAGGDRRVRTPADARGRGAQVKIARVDYRRDFQGFRSILAAKTNGGTR